MYSLFAHIPDMPIVGGLAIADDRMSQGSISGISRDLQRGFNAMQSASRLSEAGISDNEPNIGGKSKSRKRTKFQLKGFALGYNAVLKHNPADAIESIEERDEEFKATGTQNVAKLQGAAAAVGEEADFDTAAPKKPGLQVETEYKPRLPKSGSTIEPRSGMNRGMQSPSVGTPGGVLSPDNRNAGVSQVTDESEYDSEEESEEEESDEESSEEESL